MTHSNEVATQGTSQVQPGGSDAVARFRAWGKAILAKLRQPKWWASLLVVVGVFVGEVVAGEVVMTILRTLGQILASIWIEVVRNPAAIAGLAFLGLLATLIARAYWETRPEAKARNRLWLLEERLKLTKAGEEIALRQVQEAEAKFEQQARALAVAQAQTGELWQVRTYGNALLVPAALDAANFAVMFSSVEQMMPNILAAANAMSKVWQYFVSQIAGLGKESFQASLGSALGWLVDPVNDEAINPTKRAYQLLAECIATKKDPRPALAVFYARYCDWRAWTLRYAEMLHQNLYVAPGSVEWHKHDTQFFKDLEQRFTTSHFAEVRDHARVYNENYGAQFPLPAPP